MSTEIVDVAIVGGGVSGLYSGWRLLTAGTGETTALGGENGSLNVHLYELCDRLGGRLISLDPPEMPGIKAEFGGMRYLTNQPLVSGVIDDLGLATRPFPMGNDENIYYLRGHHLRGRDFRNPEKVPYRVRWQERGKTPGELIAAAIDTLIPGAEQLTAAQWRDVQQQFTFRGRHLWELGFWNLLGEVMSSEAFKLLQDAGGYNTTMTNWNAAEALPWYLADFGPEAEYRTIVDGMETLPLRQVYYFGSEERGPSPYNPELRDSLLMASYDDGPHVGYWTGLAEKGHSTTRCFPPADEPRWNRYKCPPAMIEHAQRQLKLVHDLEYLPEPYAAGFQDWGQDPYGGAWNSWNIHVRGWEVRDRMLQPLAEWPVYVTGEAYSSSQGWIEGALETAERVLVEKLGLSGR